MKTIHNFAFISIFYLTLGCEDQKGNTAQPKTETPKAIQEKALVAFQKVIEVEI